MKWEFDVCQKARQRLANKTTDELNQLGLNRYRLNENKPPIPLRGQRMIIGIDPSLTGTGLCWGDKTPAFNLIGSTPSKPDVRYRITRFDDLAQQVAKICRPLCPKAIYIEGYSFGSQGAGKISTCEYGGLLRFWLMANCDAKIIEVPPKTLKKFFTGSGNAKKCHMHYAAATRYNQTESNDNLIDAFALWRLGMLDTMKYPDLIDAIEVAGFDHYRDKVSTR